MRAFSLSLLVLSLGGVSAQLEGLPQLMKMTRTSGESCTAYGDGKVVECQNSSRIQPAYYKMHLGSCADSCAGSDGRCHRGTTNVTSLYGDCGFGGSNKELVIWQDASPTIPPCQGKDDFFFSLQYTGCIALVTLYSAENDAMIEFTDFASADATANALMGLSCPGVKQAKLRDTVRCTAMSAHETGPGDQLFTFFDKSGDERRVVFPGPFEMGTAQNGVWSPERNQYQFDFDFVVPTENVGMLGMDYQIEHLVRNAWVPVQDKVHISLSKTAPYPPVIQPTEGSIIFCDVDNIESWTCTVQMRDDVGPVQMGDKPWNEYTVGHSTNGCIETDIIVGNYSLVNVSTFTFEIKREVTCYYWDLKMALNVSINGNPIGHYNEGGSLVHTDLLLTAPIVLTPVPTSPPTPTPTFPKKDDNKDTIYWVFSILFGVMVISGLSYVMYKRRQRKQKENTGTWCVLGEGEGINGKGGAVVPIIDEEGPTSQMQDMGNINVMYERTEDDTVLAE
eukprot:TRINITY_DN7221_c0_g1_i1.p1 TRINITY_DN7221_c0_g1~~TRINITY_DN7221_c0_g1_i1.p1  ORF type:complete len:506 (+),score=75.17 TRINITY_DN7221_c0_g1_i1:2259-3776(+)